MGKYGKLSRQNGMTPGWIDIEAALRAIDGIHLGKTGVLISPLGTGATGGVQLVISTIWEVLPGGHSIEAIESVSQWPCPEGCTLEGHVLAGIYNHDYAIGEAYQQRFIPAE
jgi:hypothetical protein